MAPIQPSDASLLSIQRISQYVSLSPAALNSPLPALCASIFSPLLLSYFPPAKGIVLAYEDVHLSSSAPSSSTTATPSSGEDLLLRHVDEYTAPFVWATASFLVFTPVIGAKIAGHITHQSKTHITLSYLNTFAVAVTRDRVPEEWTWHAEEAGKVKKGWDGRLRDEGGWWIDGEGSKVGGEGDVEVVIVGVEVTGRKGGVRVEGSLRGESVGGRGKGTERRR